MGGGVEQSLANLENSKAKQTDLDSLKARVDLLTQTPSGETEGNAELLDIRVGAKGKIYPTAGEAVRSILGFSALAITNDITSDTDVNTVRSLGVYMIDTSHAIITNTPESTAGTLIVDPMGSNVTPSGLYRFIRQTFIGYKSHRVYYRYLDNNPNSENPTWSDWMELLTTDSYSRYIKLPELDRFDGTAVPSMIIKLKDIEREPLNITSLLLLIQISMNLSIMVRWLLVTQAQLLMVQISL